MIIGGGGKSRGQATASAAMSSATADSYPESVGSCRPPSPPTPTPAPPPPAPAAHRGAPVRRQLDFTDADAGAGAGGDLELDEFILSAMDDIERGYSEAKRRAPPCVCRRGQGAVRQDEQSGRWMYVCSAQPVCLPAPSKDRFFFRGFCSFGGKMVPETALGGGNSVRGEGTV